MSAPGKLLLAPIAAAFLVAGCAARVGVDGASFEKTEFSVFLDRGGRIDYSYDVLMDENETLSLGEEKIERQRPHAVIFEDVTGIPVTVHVVVSAWDAGFIELAVFEDIPQLSSRINALSEEDRVSVKRNLEEMSLRYVRVRNGIWRVSAIYARSNQGILVNNESGLIFAPPLIDLAGVYTTVNEDGKFYAYAYCGENREEDDNRQCEMKIYEAGSPVALREEVFAGYVENLAFSCDGAALYLLWRQIDIKQGPIDSLFAIAGHPNSDDDYLLSRYPLQGAAQVSTVKVARSDAGSSGTLIANCQK